MKNLTYKRKQQTKHSIKEPNNPFSLSITVNDLENKQNVRKKTFYGLSIYLQTNPFWNTE